MTIDEAIKILQRTIHYYESGDSPQTQQALQLSIEALYRCKELHKYTQPDTYLPLPGETEEVK